MKFNENSCVCDAYAVLVIVAAATNQMMIPWTMLDRWIICAFSSHQVRRQKLQFSFLLMFSVWYSVALSLLAWPLRP